MFSGWGSASKPSGSGEEVLEGLMGDPSAGLTISGRVKVMMAAQAKVMSAATSGLSPWAPRGVRALAREAAPEGRFGFGPADNVGVFNALGGKVSTLPLSVLRNVDTPPFTKEIMEGSEMDITGFLVASGICSIRISTERVRKQLLMMETIVPFLPEEQSMSTVDSRKELAKILSNTSVIVDQTWFMDSIRLARASVTAESPDGKILENWGADNKWKDGATLADQLAVFVLSTRFLPDQGKTRHMYTILLCLVSFALRGEISAQKLGKLQADLTSMMPGVAEQLSREDIALTWRNFGHLVNDPTAASRFGRWLQFIPAPIIRVRVCLAQAAGSGMTSLDIIARALKEHPLFPWYLVIRLYPDEWKNASRAITLVGDNPYFGYRGDLRLGLPRYKSVTWVCWKLLVDHGDTCLGYYRGIIPDNRNKDVFDTIIREYMKAKPGPNLMKDATVEVSDLPDLLKKVEQYPANIGTLMSMIGHAPPEGGVDESGSDDLHASGGTTSGSGGRQRTRSGYGLPASSGVTIKSRRPPPPSQDDRLTMMERMRVRAGQPGALTRLHADPEGTSPGTYELFDLVKM